MTIKDLFVNNILCEGFRRLTCNHIISNLHVTTNYIETRPSTINCFVHLDSGKCLSAVPFSSKIADHVTGHASNAHLKLAPVWYSRI